MTVAPHNAVKPLLFGIEAVYFFWQFATAKLYIEIAKLIIEIKSIIVMSITPFLIFIK